MSHRYQRHQGIRLTALDGEGIVLHLGERRYFSVNETGLLLLDALQQPRTKAELIAALQAEYEVSADQAAETTSAFLDQCLEAQVVTAITA